MASQRAAEVLLTASYLLAGFGLAGGLVRVRRRRFALLLGAIEYLEEIDAFGGVAILRAHPRIDGAGAPPGN